MLNLGEDLQEEHPTLRKSRTRKIFDFQSIHIQLKSAETYVTGLFRP